MIETKEFTNAEVDTILDALDIYESKHIDLAQDYKRFEALVEVLGSYAENNGQEEMSQNLGRFLHDIKSKEKEAVGQKKIYREKVTLLKAKLILLQQGRAVDSLFDGHPPK